MSDIKIAMVVDPGDGYDESSIQVVDIKAMQRVAPNLYILQTKPFNEAPLLNGAGNPLTKDQIDLIISSLTPNQK